MSTKKPLSEKQWARMRMLAKFNKGHKYNVGRKMSDETRKKISERHKGMKYSDETKRKVSLASTGRKHSAEAIEKIRAASTGRLKSKETRKKMSLARAGRVTSEESRLKMSLARRGSKCPSWKGGVTQGNEKIRRSPESRLWRRKCLERDNYTCRKYGITEKPRVHHINNFHSHPELRFDLDNGITLSERAHNEFHKIYGKYNNTKEQLEEFLNN